MNCIFSRYMARVSDIDSMFEFIRDNKIEGWKVTIGSRDFTNENAARAYVDDCIAREFIPWAALQTL